MAIITDFGVWLTCLDTSDYNDVYYLYRAVQDEEEYGSFGVVKHFEFDRYFVKCNYMEDTLMLASEKARETFLDMITRNYCGGMDIEGWYAYKRAMEKYDRE